MNLYYQLNKNCDTHGEWKKNRWNCTTCYRNNHERWSRYLFRIFPYGSKHIWFDNGCIYCCVFHDIFNVSHTNNNRRFTLYYRINSSITFSKIINCYINLKSLYFFLIRRTHPFFLFPLFLQMRYQEHLKLVLMRISKAHDISGGQYLEALPFQLLLLQGVLYFL